MSFYLCTFKVLLGGEFVIIGSIQETVLAFKNIKGVLKKVKPGFLDVGDKLAM